MGGDHERRMEEGDSVSHRLAAYRSHLAAVSAKAESVCGFACYLQGPPVSESSVEIGCTLATDQIDQGRRRLTVQLEFDQSGTLTSIYLHAANEREEKILEGALLRLLKPEQEGRLARLLERIMP